MQGLLHNFRLSRVDLDWEATADIGASVKQISPGCYLGKRETPAILNTSAGLPMRPPEVVASDRRLAGVLISVHPFVSVSPSTP